MNLRAAERSDAAAVAAIYAHWVETSAASFEESPPNVDVVAARMDSIARTGLPFLVAEVAGSVAGYAYLARYHDRSAYRYTAELSVYVSAEARGQGVGRALMQGLLDAAAEAGIREVIAIIAVTEDEASIELHRAFGFEEVGCLRAVGHKHGRWYDTVLMQRSLGPPGD